MDTFEALYTTRAMRRVKPDPIPEDVIKRMLDAAIRAPSPGNAQQWRFVAVTNPEVRSGLAALYERSWAQLQSTVYAGVRERAAAAGDSTTERVLSSGDWLAANFAQVPLVVLAFVRNDPDGSGIYPAVWNLMLAARAQGVGTTLTTVLHHFAAAEVAELLGVPTDKGWKNMAAITCGYPLGTWGVATRPPVETVVYADTWGQAPPWSVPEPLWSY
ncbi:MAG: nitroreductase family protein [Acidimicrobiia bacterium]|nr:nitroreductase family protein [Acidimicrobiia bacterium]